MKSSHHIYKSLKCPKTAKGRWSVYLLECSDNSLYCGSTNDLIKRINDHNFGNGAKYTRQRTPVKLVYFENHDSKSSALKRECEIKNWTRKKKLSVVLK